VNIRRRVRNISPRKNGPYRTPYRILPYIWCQISKVRKKPFLPYRTVLLYTVPYTVLQQPWLLYTMWQTEKSVQLVAARCHLLQSATHVFANFKFSLRLSSFWIPYDLVSLSIWSSFLAHSARTYRWLEKIWQFELDNFDTTWGSSFQLKYLDSSHTFVCTFGDCSWVVGWQKKRSQVYVASLPSLRSFQRSQPCTYLPLPFLP